MRALREEMNRIQLVTVNKNRINCQISHAFGLYMRATLALNELSHG